MTCTRQANAAEDLSLPPSRSPAMGKERRLSLKVEGHWRTIQETLCRKSPELVLQGSNSEDGASERGRRDCVTDLYDSSEAYRARLSAPLISSGLGLHEQTFMHAGVRGSLAADFRDIVSNLTSSDHPSAYE